MINKYWSICFFFMIVGLNKGFSQNFSVEFANKISPQSLKKHLEIIASDSMKGRETGTEGQVMASKYIANHFSKIGLQAVVKTDSGMSYFQPFDLVKINGGLRMAVYYGEDKSKVKLSSTNVLGYLEGTDNKDEVLVITAHYDHIGIKDGIINNGADDDGSGTVAVLEIANAFAEASKEGFRPKRSILFMTVSGEEKGLLGSEYYSTKPVFPLQKTVCNLNIDMVGRHDEVNKNKHYVYIIGSDKLSSELHAINDSAAFKFTPLNLDYSYNVANEPNRFYYRSDHYNFAKNGIPIIFYFDGMHPDYHQPTDDVERIDFQLLSERAKLVFYTAWEVANRPNRIIVDSNKP
ncbi:MAG: M28 family peptidase [Pseudarcicella sp.]|nr:M28 family peptidase [Pseudarcicella sp.]MBP6410739.1 M28 family peptidase [Pseudarcicella sp.]